MTTSISRRVTIEGKAYERVEDVPPEIRARYKVLFEMLALDADGDGVPDLLQDGPGYTVSESDVPTAVITTTRTLRLEPGDDGHAPARPRPVRAGIILAVIALALLGVWAYFGFETGYLKR